jgi:hypothetical protein
MQDKINALNDNLSDMIALIIEKQIKEAVKELATIMPVQKEFYSLKDAAHILSITEYGLKSRAAKNKIKLIYDHNNVTVHYKELQRYKKSLLK